MLLLCFIFRAPCSPFSVLFAAFGLLAYNRLIIKRLCEALQKTVF